MYKFNKEFSEKLIQKDKEALSDLYVMYQGVKEIINETPGPFRYILMKHLSQKDYDEFTRALYIVRKFRSYVINEWWDAQNECPWI